MSDTFRGSYKVTGKKRGAGICQLLPRQSLHGMFDNCQDHHVSFLDCSKPVQI